MKRLIGTLMFLVFALFVQAQKVYEIVEEMPQFPGGMRACMEFLANNVKYPAAAQEMGIQGKVVTSFVVNTDGTIVDVKIVRSVSPELDQETLRVISLMPKWKPGTQKGKPVRVKYTLPLNFRLSDDDLKNARSNAQTYHNPEYPGGMQAVMAFLASNVKYPEKAKNSGKQGNVIVAFVVEEDGSVSNVETLGSIDSQLDQEAKRVIASMPKWTPAMLNGKAVRSKMSLPVIFQIK